jgi:pSer/pThr/pTyr-binding forkhead associated (FHA) protein
MAVVLLITTDGQTSEYPIMGKYIIGRSSASDIVISDKQMSGKHGMFELNSQGQLIFSDLGSTNGSYLNNSQVQKIQFKIGETLRLGNTSIVIDEKRLNGKERLAIGRGAAVMNNEDHTLVMPAHKGTKSIVRGNLDPIEPEENSSNKKSVVLNKDHKKKAVKSHWNSALGNKDDVIEQEESSGKTKFLKLDINKHKKK